MKEQLLQFEKQYNVKIICVQEEEPMGTAGPIKLAEEHLLRDSDEDGFFFVMNSDIICTFPFEQMIQAHKEKKKLATMLIKEVEEPEKFGVVQLNEDNMVTTFVEKPKMFVSNKVNAGVYLFSNKILSSTGGTSLSVGAGVIPVADSGRAVGGCEFGGFLEGHKSAKGVLAGDKVLSALVEYAEMRQLAQGENIIGNVLVHPSATVDPNSMIGPNVIIGENCVVGKGVRISDSCIFSKSVIKNHAFIRQSIIGWQSVVG
eukprot:CAMPEP_0202964874 /NCGR_PEP_ID=MMETSP1396-20130829/8995_1 /ASSEMBLY_ACC=CAM_ASM_000872 /TAXON_ID= /ORGANISM="Pseudokeronopsis sp., Strain Brazil" /LENGTH=258 /DNA_ID=CAMNT_0049687347 /DNA_START=163 /DNA_END=939 /DNA_ORIENTATION=-